MVVGIADSLIVGLLLGPSVGSMLVLTLGIIVGIPEDLSAGLFEGPPLGEKLDIPVGSSDGVVVGLME
jgi:hypothetical protein